VKSAAAASLDRPCGAQIRLAVTVRGSRLVQGGSAIGLTVSALGRASNSRASRVFGRPAFLIPEGVVRIEAGRVGCKCFRYEVEFNL
jgi:hypothetical protein